MDKAAIRAYVDRPWAEIEEAKKQHRAELWREKGPMATFRLACGLYEYARRAIRGWPSEEERVADFAHHVELREKLDRAGRALAHR